MVQEWPLALGLKDSEWDLLSLQVLLPDWTEALPALPAPVLEQASELQEFS